MNLTKIKKRHTWIKTIEASRIMKCSLNALYRWCRLGYLEHCHTVIKVRKVLLISKASLLDFKEQNKNNKRINRAKPRAYKRKKHLNRGYVMVYAPNHPKAYHDGYIPEHILIAEASLGRPLTKDECVKHINGIKDDNSPANLKVYPNRSACMKATQSQRSRFLKRITSAKL